MKAGTQRTSEKKKKKFSFSTFLLVVILLAGFAIMLYPAISDHWNSIHQSQAIADYDSVVADMSATDYEAVFAKAEKYNEQLQELLFPLSQYEQLEEEYYNALDVTGTGIMGHIMIPSINVDLPVYHGTNDAILNTAVGHLEGTSLPIGGEGTHAVFSAHRGLPSAKLFTNLDKVVLGDTFTFKVLDRLMTYEVDQILIVEPTQLEALNIAEGEDYITLLTCTPYGINTHRLLVRGSRVENIVNNIVVRADATRVPVYIVVPAVAIPIMFVLLFILLIRYSRKPVKVRLEDVETMDIFEQRK